MTYNTYQEKNGRDAALDALLQDQQALICLQEVSPLRALRIKRTLGKRAFVSPAKSGLLYLVTVFPEGCGFLRRRTIGLNGYKGCIPAPWSLRYSCWRLTGRMPGWTDGLETRVVQVAYVADQRTHRVIRVLNTHLPFVPELRNLCLAKLTRLVGTGDVLVAGDLNVTAKTLAWQTFRKRAELMPTGTQEATHDSGRKIDHIMYRGDFQEIGYSVGGDGLSDHRVVSVELEMREA